MGLFKVDHNNLMGKMVEEAGQYNVRILPSSILKPTRSGKEMLVLNYEVEDGTYAGGLIRYDNVVWDDTDAERKQMSVKKFNTILVACGAPDGYEPKSIQDILTLILNRHISVTVDWEKSDYNSKYYLVVKNYGRPLETESKPNGKKRPQDDSQQNNTGFGNNSGFGNLQPQAPNNNGSGAPIDIDSDQLPF